uniref:SAC3/GANP/THP3 conserved domain-containing protein n=1 Tax=Parascaris univalens TaxID=6257 RepID=A0A914ZCE7_PARUN
MAFKIPESLQPRKPPSLLGSQSPRVVPAEAATRPFHLATSRRSPLILSHPPAIHIPRRKPPSYKDFDKPSSSQLQSDGTSQQRFLSSIRRPLIRNTVDANRRETVNRAAIMVRRRSSTQGASSTTNRSPPSKLETAKRLAISRAGTLRSGVDNRFTRLNQKPKMKNSEKSENEKQIVGGVSMRMTSKLHPTSEAKKGPPTKTISSKSEVAHQLKRLVGQICEDDYERYRLLDERDKIMSKGRMKTADVENALVTQGTCADMCPEKERYQRVVQKRMSPYECDANGVMVHELTVKDYSRSAADQEEPLPHELRPSHVLQRTMNYLISRIAENIPSREEDLAQWYDFLWNRTRAIRKDLTQQMMINETAVALIEQCARLHIFTAHRLCELGLNEFDQKMNTENLAKSLQSLRYLYDDLAKRGSHCEFEAEFRAYDVLLNLNDCNILREVLTYRRDIRESSEMRLALRLFSCVQSGNYVRFFRILKEKATYLQCCICHRYFAGVRARALYVLTSSAHESQKFGSMILRSTKTNRYPVRKLTELLGFDDISSATAVLCLYGVYPDREDMFEEENVILSKTNFYSPDEQVPPKMHSWIEAKRGSSTITEVLSGGRCLKVDISKATVSFDESGAYVCDPVVNTFLAEAGVETMKQDADVAASFTFTLPKARFQADTTRDLEHMSEPALSIRQENVFGNELKSSMKDETENTAPSVAAGRGFNGFGDELNRAKLAVPAATGFKVSLGKARFQPVASFGMQKQWIKREVDEEEAECSKQKSAKEALLNTAAEDIFFGIVDDFLRPRCQEVLMSLKILHRHKLALEAAKKQKEALRELGRIILEKLLDEVIIAVVDESTRKQIRIGQRAHNKAALEALLVILCDRLLGEVLNAEINALCALSMKENVFDVRNRLQQIAERLDKLWLKRFFDLWRNRVIHKREIERRQYEVLAAFPTVLPAHSLLRIRGTAAFESRPLAQDFSSILIEQKIHTFQQERIMRITKRAFEHWRRWTCLQIERNEFVEAFARRPMMHLRKRRYSCIGSRQSDPFGLKAALTNEADEQRRRFGPRLCDLESLNVCPPVRLSYPSYPFTSTPKTDSFWASSAPKSMGSSLSCISQIGTPL